MMRSTVIAVFLSLLAISWLVGCVGQSYVPPSTTMSIDVASKVAGDQWFGVGNPSLFTIDTVHAPNLTVTLGVNYTFNVATPSFHPFYIGTDSVGEAAGLLYGGINSGSLQWTPSASDMTQPLYFQCTNHPNMGNRILILLPPQQPSGPASSSSSPASASSSLSPSSSSALSSSATGNLLSTSNTALTAAISSSIPSSSSAAATAPSQSSSSSSGGGSSSSSGSLTSAASIAASSSVSSTVSSSTATSFSSSSSSSSSLTAAAPSSSVLPAGTTVIDVSVIEKVAGDPFFGVGSDAEYTLNGLHAPTVTVVRGTAYLFNVSVPSIHPFYITTSATGGGGGGGVGLLAGDVSQGQFTWTADSTTPSTVYYQCVLHPNLGNAISVVEPTGPMKSNEAARLPQLGPILTAITLLLGLTITI